MRDSTQRNTAWADGPRMTPRSTHGVMALSLLVLLAGGCESVGGGSSKITPEGSGAAALPVTAALVAAGGTALVVNEAAKAAGIEIKPPPAPETASAVYARDFSREYPLPVAADANATTPAETAKPTTGRRSDGTLIEVEVVPESVANGGVAPVQATPGEPGLMVESTMKPPVGTPPLVRPRGASEDGVLVDSIVGAVNGKPLRASEFLAPLAGALRNPLLTPGMTREQWRVDAAKLINARLVDQVRDELLVSSGMAELTSEELDMLSVMMAQERNKVVAENRGSEEAADRKLREEGRGGLTAHINEKKREFIVKRIKGLKIWPKVQVSMRDIEVYYRQNEANYNPPKSYTFRMIQLPTSDAEAVARITERLKAGEAFAKVAESDDNRFYAAEGGLFSSPKVSSLPQDRTDLFGPAALSEAGRKIKVGAWEGPLTLDTDTAWLFLESIEGKSKTLFQAQIEIENLLREERANKEYNKYLERLFNEGSYTEIHKMARSLLSIAEDQLLGPVVPGFGVDAAARTAAE